MLIPILVAESGVTPSVTALIPGRVIKGKYRYWRPRKPFRLPEYAQPFRPAIRGDDLTEEEFLIVASIDLD